MLEWRNTLLLLLTLGIILTVFTYAFQALILSI